MRAAIVNPTQHRLDLAEVADPHPGPDEVLVEVHGAGLGFADIGVRTGAIGGPATHLIAGTEFAGEIRAIGPGVSAWQPGQRVMGRGPGGAEQVAVRADHLLAVPDSFSWEEAGGAPVALMTAHDALVTHGQFRAGQSVLVHGATSSVGTMAVRLAAALGASTVVATARSPEHLADLTALVDDPASIVPVLLSDPDLPATLCAHGLAGGVDVVVDMVGASVFSQTLSAAAIGGRIVQVGRLGGRHTEIDLDELARKRLTLVGVTFRTRTPQDVAKLVQACAVTTAPIMDRLRPAIHRTYPLADADAALDELAEGGFFGKIVLLPS